LPGVERLGFGDVKLAAVIGAATALVSWTAVLYALVAGCVVEDRLGNRTPQE